MDPRKNPYIRHNQELNIPGEGFADNQVPLERNHRLATDREELEADDEEDEGNTEHHYIDRNHHFD